MNPKTTTPSASLAPRDHIVSICPAVRVWVRYVDSETRELLERVPLQAWAVNQLGEVRGLVLVTGASGMYLSYCDDEAVADIFAGYSQTAPNPA